MFVFFRRCPFWVFWCPENSGKRFSVAWRSSGSSRGSPSSSTRSSGSMVSWQRFRALLSLIWTRAVVEAQCQSKRLRRKRSKVWILLSAGSFFSFYPLGNVSFSWCLIELQYYWFSSLKNRWLALLVNLPSMGKKNYSKPLLVISYFRKQHF